MTVLRLLCFFGIHPRRGWEFVGDAWTPDLHVRVCIECGIELPTPEAPTTEAERDEAIRQDERERIALAMEHRYGRNLGRRAEVVRWLREGALDGQVTQ